MKRKIFSLDTITLFIILFIINFKDFFLSCANYLNSSFDSQIPLTWDFVALNNLLPYRDIYFPYGILFYLKNTVLSTSIIYFLLPIFSFITVYLVFKNLFKNKLTVFVSFISFYLFIYKYTGIENFTRYGIILTFALIISYFFYKSRLISLKASFLFGALIGIIFSLVNDQGSYSFLLFIFLLAIIPILKKVKRFNFFKYLSTRLTASGIGFILGLLPFLIFLNVNNITNEFILFIKHLSDFPLYAKTPFIPFSTTADNLFTFLGLFIAITVLSYKIFFTQTKLSFISILEISLVFVLVVLEQKSIIRSIDKQITFITFFLYVILFYGLIKNKANNLVILFCFIIFSWFILFAFPLHPFINYRLSFDKNLVKSLFQEDINHFLINKSKLCLQNNLNELIRGKNTKFEEVKNIIEKDSEINPVIFDYLSDPVFYVLFKQKPPYYFTIFEATPLYAQESNIRYIEQNKVKYIIYNKDILIIQDGVPTYARNKLLFNYVVDNFKILNKVDNIIIYKKI